MVNWRGTVALNAILRAYVESDRTTFARTRAQAVEVLRRASKTMHFQECGTGIPYLPNQARMTEAGVRRTLQTFADRLEQTRTTKAFIRVYERLRNWADDERIWLDGK